MSASLSLILVIQQVFLRSHGLRRNRSLPSATVANDGRTRPATAPCAAIPGPDAVRYMSAHSRDHPDSQRHNGTTTARSASARHGGYAQATGRFRCEWQVLGSNQRRLSRRFLIRNPVRHMSVGSRGLAGVSTGSHGQRGTAVLVRELAALAGRLTPRAGLAAGP